MKRHFQSRTDQIKIINIELGFLVRPSVQFPDESSELDPDWLLVIQLSSVDQSTCFVKASEVKRSTGWETRM